MGDSKGDVGRTRSRRSAKAPPDKSTQGSPPLKVPTPAPPLIPVVDFDVLIKEWMVKEGRGATAEDIPFLLGVVAEVANRSEDLQEDASGWNVLFQFTIKPSMNLWLSAKAGRFMVGSGKAQHPDITLFIPAGNIGYFNTDMDEDSPPSNSVDIFMGFVSVMEAYSAHKVKIMGSVEDLQKFADIMEVVRHDLDVRRRFDEMKSQPKRERNEVLDNRSITKKIIPVRIPVEEALRRLTVHFTYQEKGSIHEVSKIEDLSPNLKKLTLTGTMPEGVLPAGIIERAFPKGIMEREIYVRKVGDESEVIIIGETGPWGHWSFGAILKALQG